MVNANMSMAERETMVEQEIADFQKEVAEAEAWFKSERFSNVKRMYSAEHVVSLRSRVKQVSGMRDYHMQAKNLFPPTMMGRPCSIFY